MKKINKVTFWGDIGAQVLDELEQRTATAKAQSQK